MARYIIVIQPANGGETQRLDITPQVRELVAAGEVDCEDVAASCLWENFREANPDAADVDLQRAA